MSLTSKLCNKNNLVNCIILILLTEFFRQAIDVYLTLCYMHWQLVNWKDNDCLNISVWTESHYRRKTLTSPKICLAESQPENNSASHSAVVLKWNVSRQTVFVNVIIIYSKWTSSDWDYVNNMSNSKDS